jgi:hypothetical protein
MGWLDKILGRKKPEANRDPQLEAVPAYCMHLRIAAMMHAHRDQVESKLASMNLAPADIDGKRKELLADLDPKERFYQPDQVAWLNFGIELGMQLGLYKEIPANLSAAIIVPYVWQQCLFVQKGASTTLESAFGAYTETKQQLLDDHERPPETREGLHPVAVRMAAGILVGNVVARDLLSQFHRGIGKPTPSDEATALVARELLTRERTLAEDEHRDLPPLPYTPLVVAWLNDGSKTLPGQSST